MSNRSKSISRPKQEQPEYIDQCRPSRSRTRNIVYRELSNDYDQNRSYRSRTRNKSLTKSILRDRSSEFVRTKPSSSRQKNRKSVSKITRKKRSLDRQLTNKYIKYGRIVARRSRCIGIQDKLVVQNQGVVQEQIASQQQIASKQQIVGQQQIVGKLQTNESFSVRFKNTSIIFFTTIKKIIKLNLDLSFKF